MDTLLIIDQNGKCIEAELNIGVLTIGRGFDNDIVLPINNATLSFIKKEDYCYGQLDGSGEVASNWGKKLKSQTFLTFDNYLFVYIPKIKVNRAELKDWNFKDLPSRPEKLDYPKQLLNFLLKIIDSDQGAILHLKNNKLTDMAAKKISLRNQAELFLLRILESNNSEAIIDMKYNTHTLLFDAGLSPLDFCIIQHSISADEKIVLYLPRTKNMNEIPKGMLATILSLCAGNLANHILHQKNKRLKMAVDHVEHKFFWGSSEKMSSLKKYVDKLANTNLSILIQGETGTGKEMLVNYISQKSNAKKVVTVNCAAIPRDLAESVLFGHKKGSFTGAHQDQVGKIQEADGGILFLDEIGELDINIQAKLLRAIQENKITPVGGTEISANFWLVTATHRNLEDMIQKGEFREDLYFRINETAVKIPSLNERRQDLLPLSTYLMEDIISANKLEDKILSEDVIDYISGADWKGNIRELKAFIRKIVLLSDNKIIDLSSLISMGLLNKKSQSTSYPDDLQLAKKLFIEGHIEKILSSCGGNKTQAAKKMGITTRNLYRLLPEKNEGKDRGV